MSQVNTKISIVIPVYNSSSFIKQCLDSCLKQDHQNLEIICIDDASTDSTLSILNEYASLNDNIKVLTNNKNMGPAYCRNLGLENSTGDYIWFIDSDDWIEPNALKRLNSLLQVTQADVIGFKAQTYNNKTHEFKINDLRDLSVIPEDFFNIDFKFEQGKSFIFLLPLELWSRIFKKEFLQKNKLKFDTEIWGLDDGLFVTESLICAQSLFYSKDILYTYRTHNSQSILGQLDKPNSQTCNITILYARKCNQMIQKYMLPKEELNDLILRNLQRILSMYPKIKAKERPQFFYEFKSYLLESKDTSQSFVKTNSSFSTLKDFERLSYKQYVLKNFCFQIYKSPSLKRILLFNIVIYKRKSSHHLTTERYPFSLLKILTSEREGYKEIQYLLLGLPVYKKTQRLKVIDQH